MMLHIICERDVGLFSLVQQVIANVRWALREERIPIAYFQGKTCYWTPNGYHGCDTVWEYYFEPLFAGHPAASIPRHVRDAISERHPHPLDVGYFAGPDAFVSNHFGDHPELLGKSLFIPYLLEDPGDALRREASALMQDYIRPRAFLLEKVNRFFEERMKGRPMIGVHIRGTDAVSKEEIRWHRQGSLRLANYVEAVRGLLAESPGAGILVATDEQSSLDLMKEEFGSRVIAYDSIRHDGGEAAGRGPTGWIMPAYIAQDRDRAARNGEEAIIEYLLLARCNHLVHNGSSLSRTVLLMRPEMPQSNTHGGLWRQAQTAAAAG